MSRDLLREHYAPWILAVLAAVAALLLARIGTISLPLKSPDSYLSAVISLGGVLTGFMATLKALLYGMGDATYERLRSSGYLSDLLDYLREALVGSVCLCVAAMLGFFVPSNEYLHAVIIGVAAFALASVGRIGSMVTKLLASR